MNICHWLSPDSLRSYRRISHQEQDSALIAAANMPVALLQPRHAPVVDADVHYAAILAGLQNNETTSAARSTRLQPYSACASDSPAAGSAQPNVTPRHQPRARAARAEPGARNTATCTILGAALTHAPVVGEHLIARRDLWPSYACNEHNGLGWRVRVRSVTSVSALVRFSYATTQDGRPYKDIRLPFHSLHRLPVGTGETEGGDGATGSLRGGCRRDPAGAPSNYTPPAMGSRNALGYPQLVRTDKCALCKTPLPPIGPTLRGAHARPTAFDDPERLQCERCGRVRYCDAWCAHIHYVAVHHMICPLPPFDKDFNAEYVERRGSQTRVIPIRGVRASLVQAGLGVQPHTTSLACTHVWTVVKHHHQQCTGGECRWCTRPPARPPSSHSAPLLHHVWFTALITRIRGTGNSLSETSFKWARVPKWAPPLVVYKAAPVEDGDPNTTWPPIDEYSRLLTTHPRLIPRGVSNANA